jgi:hypothetical protein
LHPKIIGNRVALQNETEKFIILLRNLKNLW